MLALKVIDTFLDFGDKTTLTISMENPIFDREGMERIYSYPFTLPSTPNNVLALSFANRIDVVTNNKIPATLFIARNTFEEGILIINGSTSKDISVTFQNKAINLLNDLRTVQLQDIEMPVKLTEDYCPDITLGGTFPDAQNPAVSVAIKIDDIVYTGLKSNLQPFVDEINVIYPGLCSKVLLPQAPPVGGFDGIIIHCITDVEYIDIQISFSDPIGPTVELMTVKEREADEERVADDVESIVETGVFEDSLRFPVTYVPKLYDGENALFSGYANYPNYVGEINLLPGYQFSGDPLRWETTVLPFPRLYYVLEQIASYFNIYLDGSLWNIQELKDELVIWTNKPAEKLWTKLIKPIKDVGVGQIRIVDSTIHIQNHLPQATVQELLTRIINTFCAFLTYRNGVLRFQLIRPLLKARPQDWTNYADPEYDNQIEESQNFTLDYEKPDDETGIEGQLERIDGGIDAEEFITGFFTLYDRSDRDNYNPAPFDIRSWTTPYTSESGISQAFDSSTKTSFRLLFYRGKHNDSRGQPYALATHGRHNFEQDIVGEYSLSWDEEGGLYSFWSDYIKMTLKGQTITKIMNLPITEILALRSWDHIVKKVYNEFGEFTGIVKSVKFKVSTKGIGLAEVVFVKL